MVQNMNIQDERQIHVSLEKCHNVQASGLTVTAPEKNPNADGIHTKLWTSQTKSHPKFYLHYCDDGKVTIGSLGSKQSKAYVSVRQWMEPSFLEPQMESGSRHGSAVQVKNVVYTNIKGTSASEVAIKFDCSKTHPCQGILLQMLAYRNKEIQLTKLSTTMLN
ncbi:hypothetical protein V6N12_031233 [Hibiscus sabdariffa]|uniref:Uncharacterized protein n=1 Tax=Hibiscus sabdariffa TaxID=183260 RepID=A0ABR2E9X3_9ROSI